MTIRFTTTIQATGPAASIPLTEQQAAELSQARTPPVIVRIGDASARLRVTRMGGPACIGLSKAARAQLGVEIGDVVEVSVSLDAAERTVELPPLLARALASDAAAAATFEALSYTRRKEMARSIAEAKQEATRQRRLAAALSELAAG